MFNNDYNEFLKELNIFLKTDNFKFIHLHTLKIIIFKLTF